MPDNSSGLLFWNLGWTGLWLARCGFGLKWRSVFLSVVKSDKCDAVLTDKLLQRHRTAAANLFNEIIRPSEDAVLMIDGDFTQMLDDKGVSTRLGCRFECAIQRAPVISAPWCLSAR